MQRDEDWLDAKFEEIPESVVRMLPSEWAEQSRYLPRGTTKLPGPYSFDVAPYLKEPLDCLDPLSPITQMSMMKGAQVGATVGLIENGIGYAIAVLKSAPCMFLTATDDLAKIRMDENVTKMLQQSEGLEELIGSNDTMSNRKSGKTARRLSWKGGGFMLPVSAKAAAMLRSFSIQVLWIDEEDGFPEGGDSKEGSALERAEKRTASFADRKKIIRLSTPLLAGASAIFDHFEEGDKRRYYVPCLKCDKMQVLRFEGKPSKETGECWGLVYNMDPDTQALVAGSVRYVCRYCFHAHRNSNKGIMMRRGEWRPEEDHTPVHENYRSYHISALYSPVGMFSWEDCVLAYLKGWNVAQGRAKDVAKLKVFYNTVLGQPFENRGSKLALASVSKHRRGCYRYGEIPNDWMRQHAGGPAQILTAALDEHGYNVRMAVFAWCPGKRRFLINNWLWEGDPSNVDDPATWGRVAKAIEDQEYIADDGRRYRIAVTGIDAGYSADVVYEFCSRYKAGVFPIAGRPASTKGKMVKEWQEFKAKTGMIGAHITVNFYKDRLAAKLKFRWKPGDGLMPEGLFNAPAEITDAELKELTSEYKAMQYDKKTKQPLGIQWIRPHTNVRNELWDLSVYCEAVLDMAAHRVVVEHYGVEQVHWPDWWTFCEEGALYWTAAPVSGTVPPDV